MKLKHSYIVTVILATIFLLSNYNDSFTIKTVPTFGPSQINTEEEVDSVPETSEQSTEQSSEELPEESTEEAQKGGTTDTPEPVPGPVPVPKPSPKPSPEQSEEESRALLANERIVSTFAQLKDALSNNNGIDTVYLGANISIGANGIQIHTSKVNITVVGLNPNTPTQTKPYILTEYPSIYKQDTIAASEANTNLRSIHVRDLEIVGRCYYGTFSMPNSAAVKNAVITYENIKYSGPSMGYHRFGTIRYINVTADMHSKNGNSPVCQFSEVKNIYFEGTNVINTIVNDLAVFWHPGGGNFEIADNASLMLISIRTSKQYGIFYADSTPKKIDITIGKNALFQMFIEGPVSMASFASLDPIVLKENARLEIVASQLTPTTLFTVGGDFTVGKGATFLLEGPGGNGAIMEVNGLHFNIEENSNVQIIGYGDYAKFVHFNNEPGGCFLKIDNTAKALFYSRNRKVFTTETTVTELNTATGQINYWTNAGSGNIDDPPSNHWRKANHNLFLLSGLIIAEPMGNLIGITSNYESGDYSGTPPTTASFNIAAARVISFGQFTFKPDPVVPYYEGDITGITEPGATVRAWYTSGDKSYFLPNVLASANGTFVIPQSLYSEIENKEYLYVRASKDFLYGEKVFDIRKRELKLTVPKSLSFATTKLSPHIEPIKRSNADWSIRISDTRGPGNNWTLKARMISPLINLNRILPETEINLSYINENNIPTPLTTDEYVRIASHKAVSEYETTDIRWAEDKGLLAQVLKGQPFVNGAYVGRIEWLLEDAP